MAIKLVSRHQTVSIHISIRESLNIKTVICGMSDSDILDKFLECRRHSLAKKHYPNG